DPVEAMVQAGIVRLRPILMTALSTVAGILPIAIGFGAGAESRRPMGVAVVGGMVTSTVLTLFVIPVVYVVFASLQSHARPGQPNDAADGQAGGKEPSPTAASPTPSHA
ncbi:MAG: efflux RND transporter permease subunit, partial [Verrucomicrobiota bacterium]